MNTMVLAFYIKTLNCGQFYNQLALNRNGILAADYSAVTSRITDSK